MKCRSAQVPLKFGRRFGDQRLGFVHGFDRGAFWSSRALEKRGIGGLWRANLNYSWRVLEGRHDWLLGLENEPCNEPCWPKLFQER